MGRTRGTIVLPSVAYMENRTAGQHCYREPPSLKDASMTQIVSPTVTRWLSHIPFLDVQLCYASTFDCSLHLGEKRQCPRIGPILVLKPKV